jgi:hypothetical protein
MSRTCNNAAKKALGGGPAWVAAVEADVIQDRMDLVATNKDGKMAF